MQWHAIYRMHNNIKSIGVECIGIWSPYCTHRHSRQGRIQDLFIGGVEISSEARDERSELKTAGGRGGAVSPPENFEI